MNNDIIAVDRWLRTSNGNIISKRRTGIQHHAACAGGCRDPCASPHHRQGPRGDIRDNTVQLRLDIACGTLLIAQLC